MAIKTLKLSILGFLLTASGSGNTENLLTMYQQAKATNPQLAAAAANRQAIVELKTQSRSGLLPNVILNGAIDRRQSNDLTVNDKPTYSTDKSAAIRLQQPLFRYDRWIELKQADSRIAEAEAAYSAAEQDLMVATAERYFNILSAQENLAFANAEKDAIARELDQAKQRFEVGLIAITDVHEAQARHDLAVSQEIQAASQVETARDTLRETVGQYYDHLDEVIEDLPLAIPEPADPDAWVKQAIEQNLEVLAAQAAAETARQEMRRQRAGHLPTLDLNVSSDYRKQTNNFGSTSFNTERNDNSIGLGFDMPIYQGGLVNARTREARHRLSQASEQLHQATRKAELDTRTAYRGIQTDIAQIKALAQSLVSTQTAVEAAEAGFEVGTRTVVDVLNAQRESFKAKFNYAQARYQYLVDQLRLKRATGSLAQTDLEKINNYLQPDQ
ncbi:MAG: TolC family outer membrane protein [Gammaproteobacteria bacterium]